MKLLSLRVCDHDSSMCLYDNGKIKYLKLERVYQEKHWAYNNLWQWAHDLKKYFGVDSSELDEIAVIIDPNRYHTVLPDYLFGSTCPVIKLNHHLAHAYSGWMLGESDCQIVIDGMGDFVGENELFTGETLSVYKNHQLIYKQEDTYAQGFLPRSLGNGIMTMCFELNVGGHQEDLPGKLMSLQSFGNYDDTYYENYLKKIPLLCDQESISQFFDYNNWINHCGSKTIADYRKLDWARTVHETVGEKLVDFFDSHFDRDDRIFYSGGCAHNICWNTKLKNAFPNLILSPHCGDEGLSLGGIEYLRKKHGLPPLDSSGFPYWQEDQIPNNEPSDDDVKYIAHLLSQGKVVGWYQGKGEIGPRALGNRSILMHPIIQNGKEIINHKVKHREGYRPFGASVLREHQKDYFDLDYDSPFMLYLSDVKIDAPSIMHVDGTCRHQSVGNENPLYRKLIEEFYKLTGYPFLLNTSLNDGGKPICGKEEDALSVFHGTDLDVLVFGDKIYEKQQ